jgi:hypothetical protein
MEEEYFCSQMQGNVLCLLRQKKMDVRKTKNLNAIIKHATKTNMEYLQKNVELTNYTK